MADQQHSNQSPPRLEQGSQAEDKSPKLNPAPSAQDPVDKLSDTPEKGKKLTAEEQMALYEKDLKENDWGHQPC